MDSDQIIKNITLPALDNFKSSSTFYWDKKSTPFQKWTSLGSIKLSVLSTKKNLSSYQ